MGQGYLDIFTTDHKATSVLLDTSILIYNIEGVEPYYLLVKKYSMISLTTT